MATALAWSIGYLQARDTEHRYHTPKSYQQSAKASAQRACVGLEPGAMFECVNEHSEAAYQQANSEQDLRAQQRAATSALVAAVVAFLTLIVTGVGVWFVKRTLEATLEAVKDTSEATEAMRIANEIASDDRRPWLYFGHTVVSAQYSSGDQEISEGLWLSGATVIHNSGRTPAKNVCVYISVDIWDHYFDATIPAMLDARLSKITGGSEAIAPSGQHNAVFNGRVDFPKAGQDILCCVVASVSYEIEGRDGRFQTAQVAWLGSEVFGGTLQPIRIATLIEVGGETECYALWIGNHARMT